MNAFANPKSMLTKSPKTKKITGKRQIVMGGTDAACRKNNIVFLAERSHLVGDFIHTVADDRNLENPIILIKHSLIREILTM